MILVALIELPLRSGLTAQCIQKVNLLGCVGDAEITLSTKSPSSVIAVDLGFENNGQDFMHSLGTQDSPTNFAFRSLTVVAGVVQ